MPSLTVSNTDWSLDDLLNTVKTPPAPMEFKDDPIAMACASYRAWKENFTNRWLDLEAVAVQPQDRKMADDIRTFYRGRMTFQALKGSAEMSPFRRKLYALVNNKLVITKEEIGLLHRLPYFYQEDLDLDEVFANTTNADSFNVITDTCVFTPLKRVFRTRRSGDVIQFYFCCDQHPSPSLLSVRADNALLLLMESMFEQPSLRLTVTQLPKQYRGYHNNRVVYYMANVKFPKV